MLGLLSQPLQDLVAQQPLVDTCQKVAVELSDILLVAYLDAVPIIVDDGMQDAGRVSVLFVREGQSGKELLELVDELLGLPDAFLDDLVAALSRLLLLFFEGRHDLVIDVASHHCLNKGRDHVVDLEEGVEVACFANLNGF